MPHHQVLHLHVVGADNIKEVDMMGWSDPYCVVYANDTKIGKTTIIKTLRNQDGIIFLILIYIMVMWNCDLKYMIGIVLGLVISMEWFTRYR